MPISDATSYGWVTRNSAYQDAGCLTVVTGQASERVLTTLGADPVRESSDPYAYVPEGMGSVAAVALAAPDPAVVLIEDNGYEGARPEVLRALSKKGIAASAFWNVNGVVRFGCARRGKSVYAAEVLDMEPSAVPRVLRTLASGAEDDDADLVAIAVAMVATYTGVDVPNINAVSQPSRFHPIVDPVFGLPVTPRELVGLQLPTAELVTAAQAATPQACRHLARWAAADAVDATDLRESPVVLEVLDQLREDGPVALGITFSALKNKIARELDIACDASQEAANSFTTTAEKAAIEDQVRVWGNRHWAMNALAYTAVTDPVTAALGSTYCATIRYGLRTNAAARFHQDALEMLA